MKMIGKKTDWLLTAISLLPMSLAAQTVTGSGTTGKVPVFTGTSSVGNSNISQSGANTGIGTTSPTNVLSVGGDLDLGTRLLFDNPSGYGGSSAVFGVNGTAGNRRFLFYDYFGQTPLMTINDKASGGGVLIGSSYITAVATPNAAPASGLAVQGNVGIGTTTPGAKLEVDGNVKLTSGSGASITFADGTVQSTAYTGVTCGGDYAESVDVVGVRTSYEPGDVLVIGPNSGSDVVKSSEPYSTLVTGVYSTKPGVVGRRQTTDLRASKTEVPMAMIGIVPTKVNAENGPIKRGDLLVTSSTPGYAMKGTDHNRMLGAVIGKALGNLDSGTGVIEAVITLQ